MTYTFQNLTTAFLMVLEYSDGLRWRWNIVWVTYTPSNLIFNYILYINQTLNFLQNNSFPIWTKIYRNLFYFQMFFFSNKTKIYLNFSFKKFYFTIKHINGFQLFENKNPNPQMNVIKDKIKNSLFLNNIYACHMPQCHNHLSFTSVWYKQFEYCCLLSLWLPSHSSVLV